MDLLTLEKRFSTQRKCEVFLKQSRWPSGIQCPKCGANHPYWIASRKVWECSACAYQFSVTTGTIFHRSRTPLRKWFFAIWFMSTEKKGIAAKQLERTLDVTYKTAWRMAMQVRKAMKPGYGFDNKLAGVVEVDNAYIGGKSTGGKCGRGAPGKTTVIGLKERDGDMVAMVVPDLKASTIREILNENVYLDAELLVTDELPSYRPAAKGRTHAIITHSQTFVNGNVHVMGVESFWSLFKRAIIGVYHRVSAKYLQTYLNEFVFRFNNRHNPQMFETILGGC